MRIGQIGVIAPFLLYGVRWPAVASCPQVIPLYFVLAERLHQPSNRAVCDDAASATSNAPDHIRGIKSAKSDDDGRTSSVLVPHLPLGGDRRRANVDNHRSSATRR